MRFIYFVKALQFAAIFAVIWLYLGQNKLCGRIDVLSNPTRGNISDTTAIPTKSQQSAHLRILYDRASDTKGRKLEEHWSQRILETMQSKVLEHRVQKREVSQFDGEPADAEVERPTAEIFEDKTSAVQPTDDISTHSPETTPSVQPNASKRFEWRVDGCISMPAADFFVSPPTLAGRIASQLFWSMIIVACHLFVLLFQVYLIYASHLPPALLGDFVRILIGMLLWYFALANLVYVHVVWDDAWSAVNLMTIPEFPKSWIHIEIISIIVLLSLLLELCCRRLIYSNLRIVPEASSRTDEKDALPATN